MREAWIGGRKRNGAFGRRRIVRLFVVVVEGGGEERMREKGKKEEEVRKSTFYGKTFGNVDAGIEVWEISNGGIGDNVERFVETTHWSFPVIIKKDKDG